MIIMQNPVFKALFFLSGKSAVADTPPPPVEFSIIFFSGKSAVADPPSP